MLWIIYTFATIDLLLGPFASAQGCNNNAGNWCTISPNNYIPVEVSKTQPGRITCTISKDNGLDIRIINQFGEDVRRDPVLTEYIKPVSNRVGPTEKSYDLDIAWPQESEIQNRLKILQCIGLFSQSRYPCRTSLVNIQFVKEEDATTSTEASTTTTELEKQKEIVTTTTNSEDATTTEQDEDEHTVTEKTNPTFGINKRAVESIRQSNAKVAKIRSIGQSDAYNNAANLYPNYLLLLLFALCIIVKL